MINALDKHIDAQIEAYKNNRRKDSDSKRVSNLQRYIKGEYNKDNKSIFISVKKGRLQDTAMGKEKPSISNSKCD